MRALETTRLIIRAFTLADGDTYSRLLEAAFGADSSGSADDRRIIFEYQVAADPGLALLHQPPYGDRAIVLRDSGEVVGSVGYAACLMPFGLLPSFETTTRFTSEIGLFWALFPEHRGRGYATEALGALIDRAFRTLGVRRLVAGTGRDNAGSIGLLRRVGMRTFPSPYEGWPEVIGVLENPSVHK